MKFKRRSERSGVLLAAAAAGVMLLSATGGADAQARLSYSSGQNVSPAYEGWLVKPDGSKVFLFGYLNRNWEEEPNVPVGPENSFSPGPADRGQPTRFLPRRNRFVFEVPVPEGFGDRDELVWTLKVNGIEEKAYATLRADYVLDNVAIASENGSLGAGTSSPETRSNTPPRLTVEGPKERTARVGEPVTLVARIEDDGLPRPNNSALSAAGTAAVPSVGSLPSDSAEALLMQRALRPPSRVTVGKRVGLHFAWFVLRGDGRVTFDPIQVKVWEDTRAAANSPWAPLWIPPPVPEDGRWVVRATFHEPGTYVLQGRADDGGLFSDERITIRVGH